MAAQAKRGGDSHTLLYLGYLEHEAGHGKSFVEVRDAKTFKQVARFPLTGELRGITPTPDGDFVYVAGARPGIQIIDTHTHTLINEVSVPGWANKVTFNPAGDLAYVAEGSSGGGGTRGLVYVDDVATDQVVASFKVGEWNKEIIIPDDTRAYVRSEEGQILAVDLVTDSVLTKIDTGVPAKEFALSPDGSRLFVASDDSLTAVDVRTNTVTERLPLTGSPWGMALSPDGDRIYLNYVQRSTLAQDLVGGISVIDTAEFTKIDEFPGVAPGALTVSSDGTRLYVSSSTERTTTVLNTATGATVRTLVAPDGHQPTTMALVDVPND